MGLAAAHVNQVTQQRPDHLQATCTHLLSMKTIRCSFTSPFPIWQVNALVDDANSAGKGILEIFHKIHLPAKQFSLGEGFPLQSQFFFIDMRLKVI